MHSNEEQPTQVPPSEEKEASTVTAHVRQKTLSVILDEVGQRASAATPGPWKVSNYRPFSIIQRDPAESTYERGDNTFTPFIHLPTGTFDEKRADSAFIAAARSDVPALVKALRRALDQLTEVAGANVMESRDAGDCISDYYKDESVDALTDIAQLLSERDSADSVSRESSSTTPGVLGEARSFGSEHGSEREQDSGLHLSFTATQLYHPTWVPAEGEASLESTGVPAESEETETLG